jgi:hypothetical protein
VGLFYKEEVSKMTTYPEDWSALLVLYREAHPDDLEGEPPYQWYPNYDCDTYLRWGEEEGLITRDETLYFSDCIGLEIEAQQREEGPDYLFRKPGPGVDWVDDGEMPWGHGEECSEAEYQRRVADWDRYYDGQDLGLG